MDGNETTESIIQQIQYEHTKLEIRVSNIEILLEELYKHTLDNDRHINFVEQSIE